MMKIFTKAFILNKNKFTTALVKMAERRSKDTQWFKYTTSTNANSIKQQKRPPTYLLDMFINSLWGDTNSVEEAGLDERILYEQYQAL